MSREIPYTGKYLSMKIIRSLFEKGKITHVDKTLCGNGFSTSFLTIRPPRGKRNIIIAPNKAVVISKEEAYKNKELPTKNKIKFFYQESDSKERFEDADILFFVADSFVLMEKKLKNIHRSIDKVLLDEYHSTQIQSSFRDNLVNFIDQVKDICHYRRTSIVTVTASPNTYAEVDIRLVPKMLPEIEIYLERNQKETIQRIRQSIEKGHNVVVCTNAAHNIYRLKDPKTKTVRARFIMGTTLSRGLYELVKVEHDETAPLTIVSARGFEGFDIHYRDAHVYFLEDRARVFQTFYLSNLYQAISRTRYGASYIEYCRQELSYKRPLPFKNIDRAVDRFLRRTDISPENKLRKKYKQYHEFITHSEDNKGHIKLKKNQAAIDLCHERFLYDYFPKDSAFDKFLTDRNIKIIEYPNESERAPDNRLSEQAKINNLYHNRKAIKESGVFDDTYRINPEETIRQSNLNPLQFQYLKYLKMFIRRKDYDREYIIPKRQQIGLSLLGDKKKFKKLLSDLVHTYNKRSIQKYGYKKSRNHRIEFKLTAERRLCRLILMFSRNFISTPPRWVAHRNYNILTEIGVDEIQIVADYFDTNTLEVDAKSCFLRILYALCGIELRENPYGANKKNKAKLNIALNNAYYRKNKRTKKSKQRKNARQSLQKFNINPVVIDYIMNNFFESAYKGDLFNHVSYHEKKLISSIQDKIRETGRNDGFVRRHDSIIIFNNTTLLDFLNGTKYLEVTGWFQIQPSRSILYSYLQGTELEEKSHYF